MKKIHRLSSQIISKISAGEVIERPAYAVKELIDNALDARATIIEIQIEESGLKRITVLDNGDGMSKEDLEVCFLPHTTSKISTDEDLLGIRSLGFRGEALASIAAISHITIITRTPKDIGGRIIQIRGGIVEDSAPIGSPVGTIVTAEGLFYSVPARKKFLKSAQTEFRHITDIVSHYAVMYPTIHFLLKHNKKTVLDFPANKTKEERINSLLGPSLSGEMIAVSYQDNHITINGYIAKPQASLKQNQKQFLYINNRHVTDRMLALAVREAFGTLLPASYTPVFILSLTLPHELVDVNIHPRKEQVAFTDAKQLFDAIKSGVMTSLTDHNITFQFAKFKQDTSAKLGETTSSAGATLKDKVLPWDRTNNIALTQETPYTQIAQTYILSTTQDAVFFVDQHGAHERVLYNRFREEFNNQSTQIETLSQPKPLDLALSDASVLNEHSETLLAMGFSLEHFQGNTYLLRTVPKSVTGRKYEKIILEILADLKEEKNPTQLAAGSHRMLAFLACRSAVTAGDILSRDQMHDIIATLATAEEKETCPHGRPTTLTFPLQELHKKFRR